MADDQSHSATVSMQSSVSQTSDIQSIPSINSKLLWSEDLNDVLVALDYYSPTVNIFIARDNSIWLLFHTQISKLPTEVTQYYLTKSGANVTDKRMWVRVLVESVRHINLAFAWVWFCSVKLISLAADKFVAGIVNEAKQVSLLRSQTVKSKRKAQDMTETLNVEDLEITLRTYRISARPKSSARHTDSRSQSTNSSVASSSFRR